MSFKITINGTGGQPLSAGQVFRRTILMGGVAGIAVALFVIAVFAVAAVVVAGAAGVIVGVCAGAILGVFRAAWVLVRGSGR